MLLVSYYATDDENIILVLDSTLLRLILCQVLQIRVNRRVY